jgi:peptidoglycan hydrolase-like protein with peptidoglycan-binding domain
MWHGGFTGLGFSREEFKKWLAASPKPSWVQFMVSHNTAAPYIKPPVKPSTRMQNLGAYYQKLGWSTGPNIVVIYDKVYIGTPWAFPGTNSPGFNGKGLGVEVEGDYRKGVHDPLHGDGAVAWNTAAWVFAETLAWLGMPIDGTHIKLHREDPKTTHDCPGALVTKAWLIPKVKDAMATDFRPENVDKPAPKPTVPTPSRKTIKKGATGGDVPVLQRWLKTKGYYTSLVDGDFGPKTHEAVKAAQKALGLVVDGIVGPKTWAAMASAPEKPQDGSTAPEPKPTPTPIPEPKPAPVPPKPAEQIGNTPIEDLHPSDFAISWMKRFEGLRLVAYDDVGSWAIGWGHNATSRRPPIPYQGMSITEAEAVAILKADAEAIAAEVRKVLKGIKLTQHQFDALVLDNFQRGQTQFTKTEVVQALKEGRDASPAFHAQATTSKNAGLNRRRKIEALIFDGQKPTKW